MQGRIVLFLASLTMAFSDRGGAEEISATEAYRRANEAVILRDFARLLRLPNVAGDTANLRLNAEFLRRELEERDVKAQLWEHEGAPPIVYGELKAEGAERTLGIYVHYDGQPVDATQWTHHPFEPTLYTAALEAGGKPRPFPEPGEPTDPEWRLYGRSASDDRVPLIALFAALDALKASGLARTSNFKFLFEGEEEAGSPHLGEFFRRYHDQLDVDLWLICDGPSHQSRRPQLVFGVRGVTELQITVYGATRYLHSGHYGNWAPNPAMDLARLLASMKDDNGKVLIDGFYESTAAIDETERAAIAALPAIEDSLRRELGLAATEAHNATLAERLLLPSLNIRGIESGAVGKRSRNVIPNQATASLDIRLAKGNEPQAMLGLVEAHLESQGYVIVLQEPDLESRLAHPKIARVDRGIGYKAARTRMDLPIVQDIIHAAESTSDETLILMPSLGGSLPLYLFTEVLNAPVVIVPIANHDNNQHAPDENLRLANLWYGIDLMGSLLTMGAHGTSAENP